MVAVAHVADGGAAAANVAGQAGQRAKAADRTVESTGPAQPHFLLVRPLSRQPPGKSRPSARAKWEGEGHTSMACPSSGLPARSGSRTSRGPAVRAHTRNRRSKPNRAHCRPGGRRRGWSGRGSWRSWCCWRCNGRACQRWPAKSAVGRAGGPLAGAGAQSAAHAAQGVRRQPRCTLPLPLSGKLHWDLGRVGPGTSITSASLASMLFRERRGRTWGGGLEATLRCQRVELACRVVDEAFPVGASSLAEFHIIKPTVSPSSRLVFWLLAGAAPRHSFRCKSCWQGRLGASAFGLPGAPPPYRLSPLRARRGGSANSCGGSLREALRRPRNCGQQWPGCGSNLSTRYHVQGRSLGARGRS